jgi:hypothetical protein
LAPIFVTTPKRFAQERRKRLEITKSVSLFAIREGMQRQTPVIRQERTLPEPFCIYSGMTTVVVPVRAYWNNTA